MKIRKWIATLLVKIAYRLYPGSPEVKTFFHKLMMDKIILGMIPFGMDPMKIMRGESEETK